MHVRKPLSIAAAALVATALAACGSNGASSGDRAERSSRTIDACRDHGGVAAFDDDAVICTDQTFVEDRGRRAVKACQDHGGVTAFDDDIVICRDQSVHEAEEG